MEPNWAEIVQAIASLTTMIVATGGICFVSRQIKQVERSIRSNTNERLTSESLEILRFLAEHPDTYDYFYSGKEPTGEVDNTLKYAAEMIINYMEHVVLQKETLPENVQKSWDVFVQDTYARSPLVREHLRRFKDWYQPSLLKLIENVAPRSFGNLTI
jgi:hypothetical protein